MPRTGAGCNAGAVGGNTLGELAQLEVLRQAYIWVEYNRIVHLTEIFLVLFK